MNFLALLAQIPWLARMRLCLKAETFVQPLILALSFSVSLYGGEKKLLGQQAMWEREINDVTVLQCLEYQLFFLYENFMMISWY